METRKIEAGIGWWTSGDAQRDGGLDGENEGGAQGSHSNGDEAGSGGNGDVGGGSVDFVFNDDLKCELHGRSFLLAALRLCYLEGLRSFNATVLAIIARNHIGACGLY